MRLDFLTVFLLFGFIQGIVLVIISFSHKSMSQLSHKMLGLYLIILTIADLGIFANHELEEFSHPIILRLLVNCFPYHLIMILGPAIYFHCKSVIDRDFRLVKSDLIHFYPGLLEFGPFIIGLLLLIASKTGFIDELESGRIEFIHYYQRGMEIPRAVSIIVYVVLSWKFLRKQKAELNKSGYSWVRTLLSVTTVLITVFIVDLSIFFSPIGERAFEYKLDIYTIYYPIVGFIYFMTFRLVFQKTPWYLSSYKVPEIEKKASKIIECIEKGFRNPDLKLSDISEGTDISEKSISHILNQHFNKGFNTLVNELRIKEAIKRINEEDMERLTIEGVALSVGFTSRTTFYRAFKKHTNKLPSDYMDGHTMN